jgi:alpha-beta hydrolase superfamily lysophospholipase
LSSYLTYSSLDTVKGTIILLHGIRSNKESFIGLNTKLSKLGFNSLALDSRAHGQSSGTHCTFGVKEKKDISELISTLSEKEGITENIGVWGQSLGGAIGLQALENDKRIKFGIITLDLTLNL